VSIEAEVEKEIARRALAALSTPSEDKDLGRVAHYSRSLRFFSEGQANALVVGLHGLANLVLRSLEFDRLLDASELATLKIGARHFRPGATETSAWISISAGTVGKLSTIATTRSAASVALVSSLADVQ
jgi:hypothetical protein